MNKKKIYYLTMEGITSTVFNSQVLELLNSELSIENNLTLLLMQPINVRWNNKRLKQLQILKKVNKFNVKIIPYIGFKGEISKKIAFSLLNIYINKFSRNVKKIIHCRGQEATTIAKMLKEKNENISIIADIRGVPYEELKEVNINRAKYFLELDKYIFNDKSIDYINYVSNQLRQYYHNRYNFKTTRETVIPCFASFNEVGREKNNNDTLNVLYVGGQQFYQRINDIPRLLAKIKNNNINAILCLNGNKNYELENTFKKLNIRSEFYYNLDKKELDSIYSKADIGILIRDNTDLNKVASPVKLSEYLSKGLYLIMIGEVGDFYQFIKKYPKLGYCNKNLEEVSEIDLGKYLEEKDFRKEFSKRFSKEYCINKYRELYRSI